MWAVAIRQGVREVSWLLRLLDRLAFVLPGHSIMAHQAMAPELADLLVFRDLSIHYHQSRPGRCPDRMIRTRKNMGQTNNK